MKADNPGLDFWAIVDGRAPPPPSALLLSWRYETGVLHCAFVAKKPF
jgi:hypothetical protein